jgi:hypothetical protein
MTEAQEKLLNETAMRTIANQQTLERVVELLTSPLQPLVVEDGTADKATPRWAWARAAVKK